MSTTGASTPFDPNTQSYTLLFAGGTQNLTFTINDINDWHLGQIKQTINLGCQFGALFIMFLVTWILTTTPKRKSPTFILNILALGLGLLRNIFYLVAELTRPYSMYVWFSADIAYFSHGDLAVSVLGALFQFLQLVVINMALVLNANTVVKTMHRRWQYYAIIAFSALLFILTITFRGVQLVFNTIGIFGNINSFIYRPSSKWFLNCGLAFETAAIFWFCMIFSGKLYFSTRERKKIGMKGWPATQVLTSMFGATMIIPCIFAILEWTSSDTFPQAQTLCLTIVALMLPLSSLWAGKVVRDGAAAFTSEKLWGGYTAYSEPQGGDASGKTWHSISTGQTSEVRERKFSAAPINPGTVEARPGDAPHRDSTDLDLERYGVRVKKTYSVHSGRGS